MATDPYRYFRVEAQELAEQLGKGVLELEKGPAPAKAVAHLLRLAHTLKGAARVVKQGEIADAAHAIEDALAPLRAGTAEAQEGVDAILTLIDGIASRVRALGKPADPDGPLPVQVVPDEPLRTVRADVGEMDALMDGVAEAHTKLVALRRGLRTVDRMRDLAVALAAQVGRPRERDTSPAGDGPARARTGSLATELVSLVAGFERTVAVGVEQIDRELRQVHDAAERLRLLPTGAVLDALERTARDAAQALGKRVTFDGRGGEVRLDAHVLGVLQGALVQLVRNAVAHGIESETERRAAGKPPEGQLRIEVARRGKRVAFVCRDDGRGLDIDAIRRAAERKGLLVAGAQPSDAGALFRLLLKGGISTSGAISEVSGRGVGLDVVREAAQRLRGDVLGETRAGEGPVVEVGVPVSLSALDALIVESSGISVAIPLEAVRRTLRVAPSDLTRAPDGETIVDDGESIPFITLEQILTRGRREPRRPKAWSTVIVHHGTALAALGVDRLLGTANVVLRPLPELAPGDPIVAGASLDAEGNPQIVLDPEGLVARARAREQSPPIARSASLPVLVIDDSLTTRMLEQSILEGAGYEVDLATSAEEALEKVRRRAYGLFLVDIEMPGMDGFTFVERARVDPALGHVPAILVTSRSSPEDRARGVAVGARGYVVKSEFDQADLLRRIRALVGSS
jgi:two-component system, chemotaxis family, sensor kinase CheA